MPNFLRSFPKLSVAYFVIILAAGIFAAFSVANLIEIMSSESSRQPRIILKESPRPPAKIVEITNGDITGERAKLWFAIYVESIRAGNSTISSANAADRGVDAAYKHR